MNKQRTIKRELYYIYDGPAVDHPADYALFQERLYNEQGLEIGRFDTDSKTYYFYDYTECLIKEMHIDTEKVVIKDFEYTPDGDLYHTRENTYTLAIVKGYSVLPNGNLDTSSELIEEQGWVPMGETIDEWVSYEDNGQTKVVEKVIRHEDGTVSKVSKRYPLNENGEMVSDGPENPFGYEDEYDEDEYGNWIRHRLLDKNGTIALEAVVEIEYW